MHFLKLPLHLVRSPEYIAAEPIERATWLNLLAYCCEQENGGRIENASEWKDRMWQQLCGVTATEVQLDSSLYTWDGPDLVIWSYPQDCEDRCKTLRERARKGGQANGGADAQADGQADAQADAPTEQSSSEKRSSDKQSTDDKPACGVSLDAAFAWIDVQNGKISDKPRAKALARELVEEMESRHPPWTEADTGAPIRNPMGLLINRLKGDKAYKAK